MKIAKYILAAIAGVFIIIQFIPANLPENNDDLSADLVQSESAPEEVGLILRKACYDCHSNQTSYPWYSYVAPVSWLVAKDTRHGRDELNFSDWANQSKRRKIKILSEMAEEIEEREMPLNIYTVMHKDAILTDAEIETITNWTEELSGKILNGE